uniref:Uncharacterized protein n=1 Tax=Caenorhabditis japonica TaxID=281687 RepID=A0A8R1IEE3_CAEJA
MVSNLKGMRRQKISANRTTAYCAANNCNLNALANQFWISKITLEPVYSFFESPYYHEKTVAAIVFNEFVSVAIIAH